MTQSCRNTIRYEETDKYNELRAIRYLYILKKTIHVCKKYADRKKNYKLVL